ncbi:hypothetical protein Cfor_11240, partial [Coptotermes formosanus]
MRWVSFGVGATTAADRSGRSCRANMWIMTLLLVAAVTATDGDTALYKCCGPSSSFRPDIITSHLSCDLAVSPLQVHGAQVKHGFPECCNKSLIVLGQNTSRPFSQYCIDKLEMEDDKVQPDSVVGYECDDDDSVRNLTSPTVMKITKCCLNGTYDPGSHICRDISDGQEILQNVLLRDTACFVNVQYGLSECDSSQAVVTLVVTSDNIKILISGAVVVNTSNALLTLEDGSFCMDSVVNGSSSVVIKFCQDIGTACTERPCVQKCCPDGYGMIESKSCRPSDFDFNPQFYNTRSTNNGFEHVEAEVPSFAILSNLECDKFILQPEQTERDLSYLEADGRLHVPRHSDRHLKTDKYCLEKVFLPEYEMEGIYTFLCFPEDTIEPNQIQFILCALGLITSSVFLLVTFLVYACLPSLQNLHGKTLMCHVVSLFAAYVCLSVAQLGGGNLDQSFCAAM